MILRTPPPPLLRAREPIPRLTLPRALARIRPPTLLRAREPVPPLTLLGALRGVLLPAALWPLLVLIAPAPVVAQQAEGAQGARAIAVEADRRDRGFGDYRARLEMILRDPDGDETRRELELSVMETEGGEEKSLILFESPRDIRGTALLTYSHPDRENEQWLYLPALRRTKRISATGRSSPFMGSEFAYEDLVRTSVDEYTYRYVGEEELDRTPTWVIERVPRYEGTGYSRARLWIDQAEYRVLRTDYWDLRDRELKTLTVHGYREYLDGIWRADEMRIRNLRTGESTVLLWHDYRFHTGLNEGDFSRSALGRGY